MQANERDAAYIWDMLKAAQDIQEFMSGVKFEQFNKDRKLQYAIERCVEIIGEAARRISDELKKSNSEIPWSRIISQRNFIAHEYDDVKQERMWLNCTYPSLDSRIRIPSPTTASIN